MSSSENKNLQWNNQKLLNCTKNTHKQATDENMLDCLGVSAHHDRRAPSWTQRCARERVKRGAGIKLLWAEVLWAVTVTIAQPTADGAALIPAETTKHAHFVKHVSLPSRGHVYHKNMYKSVFQTGGGEKAKSDSGNLHMYGFRRFLEPNQQLIQIWQQLLWDS